MRSSGVSFVFISSIDDILTASEMIKEQAQHLQLVFTHLTQYGIIINLAKYHFGVPSLQFLRHLIDVHGIHPLADKVKAIQDYLEPTSVCKLREFLGMVNFYRRFIPNCADTLHPLTDLHTQHGKKPKRLLVWSYECAAAFAVVKSSLAEATMLAHPKSDAPLCLMVDVSDVAVGAVFQQYVERK